MDFGSHVTAAAVIVWIIQQLKNTPVFPWLNANTDRLNRGFGVLLALASSLGIHFVSVWDPAHHTLALTISGLDANLIFEGLVGSFQTYVMQELFYHGVIKKA